MRQDEWGFVSGYHEAACSPCRLSVPCLVLCSTISLSPDGKNLYVIGDNFAISTASILVYRYD